jgi:hypothetical protein
MSAGTLLSIADDKTIPSEYGPVFDIRSGFFGDDADPKERREMAGIRIGVESLRGRLYAEPAAGVLPRSDAQRSHWLSSGSVWAE